MTEIEKTEGGNKSPSGKTGTTQRNGEPQNTSRRGI